MMPRSKRDGEKRHERSWSVAAGFTLPFLLYPTMRAAYMPQGPLNFDPIYVAASIGAGLIIMAPALKSVVALVGIVYVPLLWWALPRFAPFLDR